MPIPEFTLRDFNRIASGEYNAGQIDFATGENGQVSLAKVNNHVHQTGKNKVALSAERILEVKEAFVSALRRGGVADADIAAIRNRLGIPAEMKATSKVDAQKDILRNRFVPLSRNAVREILDEYANNGRGFGEGKMQLSWDELHAAHETAHRSRSTVRKSERTNAESLANNRTKIDFTFTHALVALKLDRSLGAIDKARNNLVKGPDAANAKSSSTTGLLNQYSAFFGQALKMMDPAVHESAEFNLCGQTVKLVKGEDGAVAAVVGKGELATRVPLKANAEALMVDVIGRAIADRDFLGADRVRAMLDKVFSRDVEGFLTAEDRTSLTRQFAAMLLYVRTDGNANYGAILNGNYNTETLVEVAGHALDGKVASKAQLDALYEKLAQDNAGLDDEMKAMLARVAGLPIAPRQIGDDGKPIETLVVTKPIVGDLAQIAHAAAPQGPQAPIGDVPATAESVKDFIADLVFSDDTMVSDVVVNRPGEKMRAFLSDNRRLAALAALVKAPAIVDTAVSEHVAGVVKEGFASIRSLLDAAWQEAFPGETLTAAAEKPDFAERFAAFLRDPEKLKGGVLAKFDSIVQTMANKGCVAIQGFINRVFEIDANAVRNEQGGFTTEPYKDKTPEQIKAELDGKDLNQILDDAASDASSPGQVALFKQVLSDYFSGMSRPADRRSAFAASLRYASTFDFAGKVGDARESALQVATAKFAGAILKGTSPLLQKMMQGLPRNVLGGFAEALDDMKSNLAPIPRKIVQAHLMKMIDDSKDKARPIESIKLVESLGAASVGEAFLCEFRYKDGNKVKKEQMVVKIMRHDAEERVKREAEVISAAAAKIGPGMLKTWQGQLAQYMTEFDFRHEAENVGTGVGLYDVRNNQNHPMQAIAPNVGSMKLSDLVPPSKNAMVCTLVDGSTVDKYFAHSRSVIQENLAPVFERDEETGRLKWDPATKKPILKFPLGAGKLHEAKLFLSLEYDRILESQKRIKEAAGLWFTEAILGSGKFHGDAHAGNLIVSTFGERIDFIDYGNMFKLETHYELGLDGQPVMETVMQPNEHGIAVPVQRPKVRLNERVELLRLFLGATLRNKAFFLQGFEKLLSESGRKTLEANRAKAEAILDAMLAKGAFSFDVCYRLQGALSELQKLGLEMPPQINCFVQSMTRFQNTMAEMNAILNQTKAAIDVLADLPPLEGQPPERDPFDFLGRMVDLQRSPEGRVPVQTVDEFDEPKVDEKGDPVMVPSYVMRMMELGATEGVLDEENGPEHRKLADALRAAPDKIAKVRSVVAEFNAHFDPVNSAQLIGDMNRTAEAFERSWNAATTDEERDRVIVDFTWNHLKNVRGVISGQGSSANRFHTGKYDAPTTFANVVMGALFTGADVAQKMFDDNFTTLEKAKIGLAAGAIATGELGVRTADMVRSALPAWLRGDAPDTETLVMNAIVEDAQKMGGDKSYKIDIGI